MHAGVSRRRRGLEHAFEVEEGAARDVVGVDRRFVEIEDGRDAGVRPGEMSGPFVPGSAFDHRSNLFPA